MGILVGNFVASKWPIGQKNFANVGTTDQVRSKLAKKVAKVARNVNFFGHLMTKFVGNVGAKSRVFGLFLAVLGRF